MSEKPKWTDKAIVLLTAGIVIAAILQTIIFYSAGGQTHKLIEAAERQATVGRRFARSANRINRKVGDAERDFQRMATASGKAIQATQESMGRDDRAWVGVVDITNIKFAVGAPAEYTAIFTNTGKSPGLHVRGQGSGKLISAGQKLDFAYPPKTGIRSDVTIQPSMRVGLTLTTVVLSRRQLLTL